MVASFYKTHFPTAQSSKSSLTSMVGIGALKKVDESILLKRIRELVL